MYQISILTFENYTLKDDFYITVQKLHAHGHEKSKDLEEHGIMEKEGSGMARLVNRCQQRKGNGRIVLFMTYYSFKSEEEIQLTTKKIQLSC